ncbi:MAG: MGMT family protein [Gammaproteobacteria bacterium]|nr:MGMT family protein [Gammaproteobacteria bacterium]
MHDHKLSHDRIYSVVCRIPKGKVATYGQIAALIGFPRHARQIGYALAALDDSRGVPWHRVINARGEISQRRKPGYEDYQRILLEDEGVTFDHRGRVSLATYQWQESV